MATNNILITQEGYKMTNILISLLKLILNLVIAVLTVYYLIGAFMPYQTLELNLAYLLFFLACVSYWIWKYQTRSEGIGFWKSF